MSRLDATFVWLNLVGDLLKHGHRAAPRGKSVLELVGYRTRINMYTPMVEVPDRKIGRKFRAAEAAWILSGDNRVETIAPYAKHIADFSDDGVTFAGAYGPQLQPQLEYVASCLATDRESRQAVTTIWRQNPLPSKDIPCTVAVQWLIRNDKLHCVDFMRSSDAWLGWPYDVFNFSMQTYWLQKHLRRVHGIQVGLGQLTLMAGSQHLYAVNEEAARRLPLNFEYAGRNIMRETEDLDEHELVEWLWFQANSDGI